MSWEGAWGGGEVLRVIGPGRGVHLHAAVSYLTQTAVGIASYFTGGLLSRASATH